MGIFKRFLQELDDPFHGCELILLEHGEWFSRHLGASHQHEFDVGKHRVTVHYEKASHDSKEYHVNYEVNGWFQKKNAGHVEPHESQQILHHVAASVHHFIRKEHPEALHMHGNTPEKRAMYKHFAKHLVKTHGGRVTQANSGPDERSIANFKKD